MRKLVYVSLHLVLQRSSALVSYYQNRPFVAETLVVNYTLLLLVRKSVTEGQLESSESPQINEIITNLWLPVLSALAQTKNLNKGNKFIHELDNVKHSDLSLRTVVETRT